MQLQPPAIGGAFAHLTLCKLTPTNGNILTSSPFICLHFLERENFVFFGRAAVVVRKVSYSIVT